MGTSIIRIWTAASRAPRRVTAAMFRHLLEHHTGRLPRPVYETGAVALEVAREGLDQGEMPIGAAIFSGHELLASA